MKKTKLIIALIAVLACCFCMSACGGSDVSEYEGNTYTGDSPWQEKMSVTINEVGDEKVSFTYKENSNDKPLISEQVNDVVLADNAGEFSFKNAGTEKKNGYEMKGIIELRDGNVVITYLDGCKYENSPEGGSTYHNVGALSDDQKTVTLTCE